MWSWICPKSPVPSGRTLPFVVALVFVPVLTLTGLQGKFFAPLALAYIIAAADAQVGAFFLCEDGGRRLVCLSAQGIDSAAVEKISGETAIDGLPGEALRRRSCVFAASFADHALPEINLGVARVRLQCIGAMPVVFREKPLGVLVLGSFKKPDAATIEFVNNHVDALANGLKFGGSRRVSANP